MNIKNNKMEVWDDLGEYIVKLCKNDSEKPEKVVEVAIGKFFGISNYLKKCENIELLMTDIFPANNEIIKDDLTNPNLKLYENAKIIYSIRPPTELQPFLSNLIEKVGVTLIIKPLFNENLNLSSNNKNTANLINYKKAIFYEYNHINTKFD